MTVSALTPVIWTFSGVVESGYHQAKAAFKSAVPLTGWKAQDETSFRWSDRTMKVLDYMPNLWCFLSSGLIIAKESALLVPGVVRMSVAALGALNILLIPTMALTTIVSLWALLRAIPNLELTGILEGTLRVVHLSGLASLFTLIGATGLRQFFDFFETPIHGIKQVIAAIAPWISYVVRVSVITQLMDISSGVRASAKLSHVLRPMNWKQKLVNLVPTFLVIGNRVFGLTFGAIHYSKSLQALKVLQDNRRLLSKVVASDDHFRDVLARIERRVKSWRPLVSLYGCWQAQRLAQGFESRVVTQVHNQLLGLSANTAAAMGMIMAANIAAAAAFASIAALFFLMQTYHRQTYMESY